MDETPPEYSAAPFSRSVGSQGEVPEVELHGGVLRVSGYQNYAVHPHPPKLVSDRLHKYNLLRPFLLGQDRNSTLLDLGCSSGAVGISAYLDGFTHVTFADHDPEYLAVVQRVLDFLGAVGTCDVVETQFSALDDQYDVVIGLSIIHWLYSATENYGSLDGIVERLRSLARRTLIVEWVPPTDPVIAKWPQGFPQRPGSPYSFAAFKDALVRAYPYVRRVGNGTLHREIWMASTQPINPDYGSAPTRATVQAWFQSQMFGLPPAWYSSMSQIKHRVVGAKRRLR